MQLGLHVSTSYFASQSSKTWNDERNKLRTERNKNADQIIRKTHYRKSWRFDVYLNYILKTSKTRKISNLCFIHKLQVKQITSKTSPYPTVMSTYATKFHGNTNISMAFYVYITSQLELCDAWTAPYACVQVLSASPSPVSRTATLCRSAVDIAKIMLVLSY